MWRIASLCVCLALLAACESDGAGTSAGSGGDTATGDAANGDAYYLPGTYMWWDSYAAAPRDCETIDAALAAARARWAESGPDSYRFRFSHLVQVGAGRWEGVVLDGEPAGWIGADLSLGYTPSQVGLDTIPALFDHVERRCAWANEHPDERCGTEVAFDEPLGYPTLFRYDCHGIDEEEELELLSFGPPDPPLAGACQAATDALLALYEEAGEPPAHLVDEEAADAWDPALDGSEFDVMRVFDALDRLSMEDGWVLDWVYHFDGGAGAPILYARRADAPRFLRESEWLDAYRDEENRDALDPFRHLVVDGSDEGWCQLAAYFHLHGQFYLWWHAHYDDDRLVFTRRALEDVLAAETICPDPFTAEQKAAARTIELAPEVEHTHDAEAGADVVRVRYVHFTKWGGFTIRRLAVREDFPHDYRDLYAGPMEEAAPYACGVVF